MVEWVKRFLKVKENDSVNITYINIIGPTIGYSNKAVTVDWSARSPDWCLDKILWSDKESKSWL